jgi:hypothetical protein
MRELTCSHSTTKSFFVLPSGRVTTIRCPEFWIRTQSVSRVHLCPPGGRDIKQRFGSNDISLVRG